MNIPGSILYDAMYERTLILIGENGDEFVVIREGGVTKLSQTIFDAYHYDLEQEFSRHRRQYSR